MFIHCSIERDTGVLSMMATKHHSNNYNLDTLYHRERKILFIKSFVVVRILCASKIICIPIRGYSYYVDIICSGVSWVV